MYLSFAVTYLHCIPLFYNACFVCVLLQITNCNAMTSYNITGLQSFTTYTVSATVCTIDGEGPMTTVPSSFSTMTGPGTPTPVQAITVTSSSDDTVTFSWSSVQFNGMDSGYTVR